MIKHSGIVHEIRTSCTECPIDGLVEKRYTVSMKSIGTKGADTNVGKNQ